MLNTRITRENSTPNLTQSILAYTIMISLSVAFVLSDWIYNNFTFSEYILVVVLTLLLLTLNFRLTNEQLLGILLTSGVLAAHIALQWFFNEAFELRIAIPGMIKLLFYIVSVSVIVNYIRLYNYEKSFLFINNIAAVITIILGLYITYALYQESRIPQEIFWRFTRRDIYSYYFESNPAIIRTRSLFSEPAHLGFYLNTLLVANLFTSLRLKMRLFFVGALSIGILLTFSYSMIAILAVICMLKILQLLIKKQLIWSNWYLLIPIVVIILTIYNWEVVNTTLIQRTLAVLTGQDTSARMRLFDSWQYVTRDNIVLGNGIGHTPVVTNVYAYALSDFGIAGFSIAGAITAWIAIKNWQIGVVFILLNSAKGGYLSSSYWFMIMILVMYGLMKSNKSMAFKTPRSYLLSERMK